MSRSPLVSVVIPTRNRAAPLGACLDAVSRQTYPDFEVIVVDDGSTDSTPDVLARFAAGYPHVKLTPIRNEPQIGANPARNRGIERSAGEFVAFLDDDCVPAHDWLERLLGGFVSDRVAAVTGRVDNKPPANVYELTLKGTQRVHGRTRAGRLVAGNMCVRRAQLMEFGFDEDRAGTSPDVTVSGRGDEEGLHLLLKASGYEQRVVHDAVVVHAHPHTRRTFYRQAYRGGAAAARLGYKYRLAPRVELVPLLAAYLTLPLARQFRFGWFAPAVCAGFFLAAILYNDLFRKMKTPYETFVTFPMLLAYYHARLLGYAVQYVRLWLGLDRITRHPLHLAPRS